MLRRMWVALLLACCVWDVSPLAAASAADVCGSGGRCAAASAAGSAAAESPSMDEVLEYVRLYGYREMLEQSAERQLAGLLDSVRRERPDVAPDRLEIIRQEMRGELRAISERSVNALAEVLQRDFTRADVELLLRIGHDPRMRHIVGLQPKIALELEDIGGDLAAEVTRRAVPRIAERLKVLRGEGEE